MLKRRFTILFLCAFVAVFTCKFSLANTTEKKLAINFFGDSLQIISDNTIEVSLDTPLNEEAVDKFYEKLNQSDFQPLVQQLLDYKNKSELDDWLYYQLIRRTAQQLCAKDENYYRYTLYKWFLLVKSGYDATLSIGDNKLLFYVRSDDNIYDIPFFFRDGKQYVCLNRHDYKDVDLEHEKFYEVKIRPEKDLKPFSYKVTKLPEFAENDYIEKELHFKYGNKNYHFEVRLNPQVQSIFANYPVVDFENYFNIPLSKETYASLIPMIQKEVKKMSKEKGVEYIMNFTRYAFLYENDQQNFGKEKRLSPEETLLYQYSDCDDRAALFFYLVKEVYNLPMIVLLYPKHISIAVKFNKAIGEPIVYNGEQYSICDPTAQTRLLKMGEMPEAISKDGYNIVYAYHPADVATPQK